MSASHVSWLPEFRDFFSSIADRLPMVLRASGCREGWIQAEAFQFFRTRGHSFWVNTECVSDGAVGKRALKADFASYTNDTEEGVLLFVGELKVFGVEGYQYKNLDGGGLRPYLRRLESTSSILFSDDDQTLTLARAAGGLLHDWGRLRAKAAPAKLLVLVLDLHGIVDDFGRVIQAVEFGGPGEMLLQHERVLVKAWTVA